MIILYNQDRIGPDGQVNREVENNTRKLHYKKKGTIAELEKLPQSGTHGDEKSNLPFLDLDGAVHAWNHIIIFKIELNWKFV